MTVITLVRNVIRTLLECR